ncbi:glycosyltransferase [Rhabdaerophilum sp. SD176]|uniref:glycosyltransferase n=1 Tax=Rhabdaerophilum sp. SD176 TaxID=2983548 RepID=UPI0024DF40D2|nr:glycosyltransferase [Rhabdaerophilum sp. SD176]
MSAPSFVRFLTRLPVLAALLVTLLHATLWGWYQEVRHAPDLVGRLASMSYTAFEGQKRERGDGYVPTADQIRNDFRAIAPYTKAVRTYTVTEGTDLVPGVAAEFGMRATIGAWLDNDPERNTRELERAIKLANTHWNVNGIYVGNELNVRGDVPILRGEQLTDEEKRAIATKEKDALERATVNRLIKLMRRVKAETGGRVPVSTGEIYTVWLKYPELVEAADFIAIHVLPYWEGTPANQAVDSTFEILSKVQAAYPNKKVKISEFGWPSAGYNRHGAAPGRLEQAVILRDFAARANWLGVDYNIIEAYDQPWKTFEGGVGPYWGAFSTDRNTKFPWTGPIHDRGYTEKATVAVIAGLLLSLLILFLQGRGPLRVTTRQALVLTLAANAVGAWAAFAWGHWVLHYFVPGAAFAFLLGMVLLVPLVIVALNHIAEIAQFLFGRKPSRLLAAGRLAQAAPLPKVSIHIPACREPAEMLKETLDSVARLDYPDFECIVLINNTPDEAMVAPVEEHCRLLGPRFKFVNAGRVEGFKAKALQIALDHTDPAAEIIGVIDADYIVDANWLRDLVPAFADARVGLVQAPQDHRDGRRSPLHQAMNAEYAGFFDIGMVLRNEENAIITHGTMCLVRRAALESAGGWSEDTICEDTDLGLSILEKGWLQHYTNRRYGRGLLPNTFRDYKKQRHRWASGGMQIVFKHARAFLPGRSKLSLPQRRTFAAGWLSWLANESLGVLIAILNIVWTPVVAFLSIAVPDKILTLPILFMLGLSLLHFGLLYKRCVDMSAKEMALALMAHMSLQWTMARAVGKSLFADKLVFIRTDKGGKAQKSDVFAARGEAIMAGLLLASATMVVMTNYTEVRELYLFAAVMVVQAIPFLFAVLLALMERLPESAKTRMVEFDLPSLEGLRARVATSWGKPATGNSMAGVTAGSVPFAANDQEPQRKSG